MSIDGRHSPGKLVSGTNGVQLLRYSVAPSWISLRHTTVRVLYFLTNGASALAGTSHTLGAGALATVTVQVSLVSSVDIVSYPLAPYQGVPPSVDCGTQPRSGSIGRVAGNLLFTPHISVPPTVPRSCIARKRRNGLGLVVHPRNGSSMCRVALFLPRIVAQSNLQRNGSPLLAATICRVLYSRPLFAIIPVRNRFPLDHHQP